MKGWMSEGAEKNIKQQDDKSFSEKTSTSATAAVQCDRQQ